MRRAPATLALAALAALAAVGCAPTVRAGDYYATPLERAAAPRARLQARWRVQPAPATCATVGAPIVFLPALGLSQHSWAGVTAALGACRPRVLVDLPGVGEAPLTETFGADEVLAAIVDVVDAVAPDGGRVVLAGHSLGGAIAARLAARLGARVRGARARRGAAGHDSAEPLGAAALPPSLWPPLLHLAGGWAGVRLGLAARGSRRRSHHGARRRPDRGGVGRPPAARGLARRTTTRSSRTTRCCATGERCAPRRRASCA